jgi:hypothetical protein
LDQSRLQSTQCGVIVTHDDIQLDATQPEYLFRAEAVPIMRFVLGRLRQNLANGPSVLPRGWGRFFSVTNINSSNNNDDDRRTGCMGTHGNNIHRSRFNVAPAFFLQIHHAHNAGFHDFSLGNQRNFLTLSLAHILAGIAAGTEGD